MKNNIAPKRLGIISASPAQFLIHQRLGRVKMLGRGRSVLTLPWIDRYWLIPSSVQSLSFCADQITAENQGVEISGFAIWNIVAPEKAMGVVDFQDPNEALERIGDNLRSVVESAIRHQVANLSLNDTLRQRETIIAGLKAEIFDIATAWGLEIATIEIKTVRVMSSELFENLQASFRNQVRLESARAKIETDHQIQHEQSLMKEKAAQREQEFQEAQTNRSSALTRVQEAAQTKIELARLDNQLLLCRGRAAHLESILPLEKDSAQLEQRLTGYRAELEQTQASHRQALAAIENATEAGKIATSNARNSGHLLIEALPKMLQGLNIAQVNLGDPLFLQALSKLTNEFQPNAKLKYYE